MIINYRPLSRYRTSGSAATTCLARCAHTRSLSTCPPIAWPVLAYDIAFDDGRRLTVEEADLELMTAAWRAEHQAGE